MNKIEFKSHILPHLVAVMVFLFVVVLFFNPIFFENKVLHQSDILQWEGGAKELIDYRQKTGEEGLWTNSMFSGMPGYLVNVEWDNYIIVGLQRFLSLGLPHPVWYIFLSFISYYIMLLVFGVRPYLAICGAIAFGFSSHMIIGLSAGHNARIGAIAFTPLVVAGVHLTYGRFKLVGFALTAAGLAMHLRINHLQITYYLLLILIFYSLYRVVEAIRSKDVFNLIKSNLFLFGAAILAVGTFMGSFWSVYQYSRYSTRGPSELVSTTSNTTDGLERDYAFVHSNDIFEPLVLFIPNFYGGSSNESLGMNSHLADALRSNGMPPVQIAQQIQSVPTYWGRQPGTAPYYAGAIIMFFFVLGMLMIRRRHSWWLVTAIIFSIMLTWGHNFEAFNYFMFDSFPGYNKFRSVTFALIIALFCIPLLGLLGVENLLKEGLTKKNQKNLFIALSITAGFALLSIIFANFSSFKGAIDERLGNLPEWFIQALREDRRSLLQTDAFRSMALVLAAGALLYFYLKDKLNKVLAFSLLNIMVIGDLWLVNRRYLDESRFQRSPAREFFAITEADQVIKQDSDIHYRVYSLQNPFNDARTSYFHSSIGGYHGAKLRRYSDLIEHCLAPETNAMIQTLQSGNKDLRQFGTINMLNAKYLIAGSTRNHVIENDAALGNAWLISEIVKVNSPDEELQGLCDLDKETAAIVDASQFNVSKTNYHSAGSISLEAYEPNYLRYNYESPEESFAVFSEIYYPEGWRVTVDGEETAHIRANYVLRAMELPAGKHVIEFRFVPKVYTVGNTITLISSILLVLVIIISALWYIKYGRDPLDKEPMRYS